MPIPLSVLLPLYYKDSPNYLDQALCSVTEGQVYLPSQIVVVKDGLLTVELDEVLTYYLTHFPRLFLVVGYPLNKGLSHALNFGLKFCSFELVARMDSDDISHPFRLLHQFEYMANHPRVDIMGGYSTCLVELDQYSSIRSVPLDHLSIRRLIWSCPFNHPTVIFRKSSINIPTESIRNILL